jgi:hypothetical protein
LRVLADLTTGRGVGIIANMDATLLMRRKERRPDDYLVEIVIWQVPHPVPGSRHDFKYRLFFGRSGRRLVGYDNERGKGDHKHVGSSEMPYRFQGIEQLLRDFESDVNAWRIAK